MESLPLGPDETDHDLFCPECGYDVHGLSEHRCPECGQTFDPALLLPVDPKLIRFRRQFWRTGLRIMPVAMLIGAFDYWSLERYPTNLNFLLKLPLATLIGPPMFTFALAYPILPGLGIVALLIRAKVARSERLALIGWLLLGAFWVWVFHDAARIPD